MKDKNTQANNPNELTTANSVLVLIDHQPWIGLLVHSIDPGLMINNVAGLAQAAKNLGVPTILTTIGAKGSVLVDPLFKELTEIFPDVTPIDRTSTHAWSHPEVRAAIDATGRKKLIMAGLVTEVCLAQSVLAALKEGYEVFFVSNCSGGATVEAHEDAKARMVQAGAKPIDWLAVISEWAPDYTSPERAVLGDVWSRRGGIINLAGDYVLAQVTAGLVPMPSWAAPGQATDGQADGRRRDQPPRGGDAVRLRDQGFRKGAHLLRAGRGDCHARPSGGEGRAGLDQGHQGRSCGSQPKDHCLEREDRGLRLG